MIGLCLSCMSSCLALTCSKVQQEIGLNLISNHFQFIDQVFTCAEQSVLDLLVQVFTPMTLDFIFTMIPNDSIYSCIMILHFLDVCFSLLICAFKGQSSYIVIAKGTMGHHHDHGSNNGSKKYCKKKPLLQGYT